jgi:MFS transporter, DHA1 family, multidrug resistance protein
MTSLATTARSRIAFFLVAAGTVLELAGTDLVLPAVPALPHELGGDLSSAQWVIAAFVAGVSLGLLIFGAVGPRFGRRRTMVAALLAYSSLSFASAFSTSMSVLIGFRFLQGVAASAPAVFAPAIIRALFDDAGATRALGLLGSIESLVPAFAPVVGAWLLWIVGWRGGFVLTAVLAALLALGVGVAGGALPSGEGSISTGSYLGLARSPVFLRYALSHAFVLGGLLVFVFGAPAVIVRTMHGGIEIFIAMQIVGIGFFILAANLTGLLLKRFGSETMIVGGTLLAAGSALLILAYASVASVPPAALVFLTIPLNLGLGFRGPPGFLEAVKAGRGDDERAASLATLAITAVAAGGTAILAPFIQLGLPALALAAALLEVMAVAALALLPRSP